VLVAPDKFRGTLSAREAAAAMASGARQAGAEVEELPLADGGEGTLDVLGGPNRWETVTGPLGAPVVAGWRHEGAVAIVETALACGLARLTGPNDPLRATSRGAGELVAAAILAGAGRVLVGVGGSASTDGGAGAVEVLEPFAPLDGSRGYLVEVACDVRTRFADAADRFGPQKGASQDEVALLRARLEEVAEGYRVRYGVEVRHLAGSGAAGGLAGGLAALGACLRPGFALVAARRGLEAALGRADLVLSGEGRLDTSSFDGKVVGSLLEWSAASGVPLALVVGEVACTPPAGVRLASLVGRVGSARALAAPAEALAAVALEIVAELA